MGIFGGSYSAYHFPFGPYRLYEMSTPQRSTGGSDVSGSLSRSVTLEAGLLLFPYSLLFSLILGSMVPFGFGNDAPCHWNKQA